MALSFVTACDGKTPVTPSSSDLVGRVVKVADGDTITILDASKTQHKIRLQGIDAPEKDQAYGDAAGRYLSGLVAGQEVRVVGTKRDKYNRILGTVFANGEEVNLAMLRAGYAWHYKRFDSTPAYAQAESEARAAKRGLWAGVDRGAIEAAQELGFPYGGLIPKGRLAEDGSVPEKFDRMEVAPHLLHGHIGGRAVNG